MREWVQLPDRRYAAHGFKSGLSSSSVSRAKAALAGRPALSARPAVLDHAGRAGRRAFLDAIDSHLCRLPLPPWTCTTRCTDHVSPHPYEYFYFSVDRLEEVHARAAAVGGREVTPLEKAPSGEEIFYLCDPFGNGLGFVRSGTELSTAGRR